MSISKKTNVVVEGKQYKKNDNEKEMKDPVNGWQGTLFCNEI